MSSENAFPVTLEQLQDWKHLASVDPARVVRVLELPTGQRTPEGDTIADIAPALLAVKTECAMQSRVWDALVNAGVISALCQNVMVHRVRTIVFPDDPMEPVVIKEEIQSPNYQALAILSKAAASMEKATVATNKRFLADLVPKWKNIATCVWNDMKSKDVPADNSHVVFLVASMLLSSQDASFYASVCQKDNMTIPILVRIWTAYPSKGVTSTLDMLLQPSNEVATNPSKRPTKASLIKQFYLGIDHSSRPGEAVATKASKIFARHLSNTNSDFKTLAGEMRLLEHLVEFSINPIKGEEIEVEFGRAVRRSEQLWRAVFGLLRRVVKKSFKPDQKWDMDKFRAMLRRNDWKGTEGEIFRHFISMWRKLAWKPTLDKGELEAVVETMTRAGLFTTLDDTIYALIQVPGITQFLTIIFQSMIEIVESSPKLLKLLDGEFPRANTLFSLFRRDMHIQTTTGGIGDPQHQRVFASLAVPAFDSPIWDHGVWQTFYELQCLCRDWKEECGWRECPNRRGTKTGRAMVPCEVCKQVVFCSSVCRDRETEHDQGCRKNWVSILRSERRRKVGHASTTQQLQGPPQSVGVYALVVAALLLLGYSYTS